VWLNTAHQGALPVRAAEAAATAVRWKQAPHCLTGDRFHDIPERLRARLGGLLSVPPDEVILANSSSYGLHLIVEGFPWRQGDEVLLVRGDFPSTTLPWRRLQEEGVRLRFLEPSGGHLQASEVDAAIGRHTRLLCTTWVHSFTGHTVDVTAVGAVCRARGVAFVLNASQGVGARPLRPLELPVDAVTGVGSKWLCGPYGTGFCWLTPAFRDRLRCRRTNWLSLYTVADLEGDCTPDLPDHLRARDLDLFSTANFFNFLPWIAALEVLESSGLEAIAERDQGLVQRILDGLPRASYRLLSPAAGPLRSTLVFLTHRDPRRTPGLYARLTDAGIDVSLRRGHLRVSPHLYNTEQDIDRVLEALAGGA